LGQAKETGANRRPFFCTPGPAGNKPGVMAAIIYALSTHYVIPAAKAPDGVNADTFLAEYV